MPDFLKRIHISRQLIAVITVIGIGVIGSYVMGFSNAQTPQQPPLVLEETSAVLRPYSLGTAPYQYIAFNGSIDQTRQQTGIKNYFAAFIVSSDQCVPSWGGKAAGNLSGARALELKQDFDKLKAAGGEVVISFGGSNGSDIASTCSSPEELAAAYKSVIDMYGVRNLDFDIEGPTLMDTAGNARRVEAVAALQKQMPDLKIWLTLPVHGDGLTKEGIAVVQEMENRNIALSGINIMAMNYNIDSKDMGRQAVRATAATYDQLKQLFPSNKDEELWKSIGITVMIGRNDTTPETLSLEDARLVRAFAVEKGIGLLSQWNSGRDVACAPGSNAPQPSIDCSGVAQTPYEYLKILTIPRKP